jgi:5-oxoprolinase (ATP-hydrolysing)
LVSETLQSLAPIILRHSSLPNTFITLLSDYIRLSTTVATNALLERKGHKHALLITKGFKDLLLIGNQSRPKIFDLNIRRPPPLYSKVVEVDERVTLVGYTSDPQAEEHAIQFDDDGKVIRGYRGKGWDTEGLAEGPGEIVRGISGEAVRIIKKPGMLDITDRSLFSQLFFY